jgi:putative DNA primase/helicase
MRSFDTIERARGRWREILPRLGIATSFLVNRHGPCSLCGGKDRFRFDDREGTGSYICGQCGAGVGIILLRKLNGWDHKTACEEVDKIIGNVAPLPEPPRRDDDHGARLQRVERMLAEADAPQIVAVYLQSRGLTSIPQVLRGHPALPYVNGSGTFRGRIPAVVAPVLGPDGALVSAQRIYTDMSLVERKMTLPAAGTIKGGAVRLFDLAERMGIAEGCETAIAAHELFGLPVWAALTADNMALWLPPAGVKHVTVYADHDASFTGHAAAYALARRLTAKRIEVEVQMPPQLGADWLDMLCARTERGAA